MIANIKICRKCEWCFKAPEPGKKIFSFDCIVVTQFGGVDRIGQKHGKKYIANKSFEVPTECPMWLEQTIVK